MKTFPYPVRLTLFPLLLLLLLITACGEDETGSDDSDLQSSGRAGVARQAESADPSPTPPAEARLPAEALAGEIFFIQGNDLYHLPAGHPDAEPALVAAGIPTADIYLSPNRRFLLATVPDEGGATISLFSAENPAGRVLWEFGGRAHDWTAYGWSPDDEWAFLEIDNQLLLLNLVSGEQQTPDLEVTVRAALGGIEPPWLADGRVVPWVDMTFNRDDGSLTISGIHVYDPATGRTDIVSEGLPISVTQAAGQEENPLKTALAAAGLTASFTGERHFWYQAPAARAAGGDETCATWAIHRVLPAGTGQRVAYILAENPLYSADEVYKFSHLIEQTPAELLFLEWHLAGCQLGGEAEVVLMQLTPDGPPKMLAAGLFPGVDEIPGDTTNPVSAGGKMTPPYAPSPGGDYVAWLGGTISSGSSTLNRLNIASGENSVLLEVESSGTSAQFIQAEVIQAVYWLAP